jgi:hypothetical protein
VKVQRLVAAASLALALLISPTAKAGGFDEPGGSPQGFICDLGDCLSQAVFVGLDIVSSAL